MWSCLWMTCCCLWFWVPVPRRTSDAPLLLSLPQNVILEFYSLKPYPYIFLSPRTLTQAPGSSDPKPRHRRRPPFMPHAKHGQTRTPLHCILQRRLCKKNIAPLGQKPGSHETRKTHPIRLPTVAEKAEPWQTQLEHQLLPPSVVEQLRHKLHTRRKLSKAPPKTAQCRPRALQNKSMVSRVFGVHNTRIVSEHLFLKAGSSHWLYF